MFAEVFAELEGLGAHGLAVRLQEFEQQRRALEAAMSAVVNVARRHDVYRADGHRSVRSWMQALTNCSDLEATHFSRLGDLLHDIDECGDQLSDGRVGVAAMAELARARRNPRCGDQLVEAVPTLLRHAAMMPVSDFKRCVKRWELTQDPDGSFKDVETNHRTRTASLNEIDGTVLLRAAGGTSAVAAEMKEIFDRFCHAEFLADRDELIANDVLGTNPGLMARTDAQRRFDALAAIFRAAACAPLDARVPEPTVNFIVDQRTFEEHLARTFGNTSAPTFPPPSFITKRTQPNDPGHSSSNSLSSFRRGPFRSTETDASTRTNAAAARLFPADDQTAGDNHRGWDTGESDPADDLTAGEDLAAADDLTAGDPFLRRSETSNGTLVHPAEILAASIVGHVRRVVLDSAGNVIDLGRRRRLFTGAAREAVMLHARSCIWPGCNIPAGRCEADHLEPWNSAGSTTPENGAPVCRRHNQTKNAGFTTRRDPHGHWHVYRPDGTELTQPPTCIDIAA